MSSFSMPPVFPRRSLEGILRLFGLSPSSGPCATVLWLIESRDNGFAAIFARDSCVAGGLRECVDTVLDVRASNSGRGRLEVDPGDARLSLPERDESTLDDGRVDDTLEEDEVVGEDDVDEEDEDEEVNKLEAEAEDCCEKELECLTPIATASDGRAGGGIPSAPSRSSSIIVCCRRRSMHKRSMSRTISFSAHFASALFKRFSQS
mmetsp:Transcript_539/g.1382  ORF Transcript_539/g.1382 Transcript_539/m.1382 type:complete len:206 (-) Transcript_539:54-671(-)